MNDAQRQANQTHYDEPNRGSSIDYMHAKKGPIGGERPIRPAAQNRTGMPPQPMHGSQSEKKPGSYAKLGDDPRTLNHMLK